MFLWNQNPATLSAHFDEVVPSRPRNLRNDRFTRGFVGLGVGNKYGDRQMPAIRQRDNPGIVGGCGESVYCSRTAGFVRDGSSRWQQAFDTMRAGRALR